MNSRIFREYSQYSFEDLQERLGVSEEKLLDIIKTLSYMNIAKKKKGTKYEIERDELQDFESVELPDEKEDYYYFRFVGILMIEDIYLIIYPKYLSRKSICKDKDYKKFKQVIDVIKKHNNKVDYNRSIAIEDGDNFNLLSLALSMIDSYNDHGLYITENDIIEENGEGEILWDMTINNKLPYFSKNKPIYFNFYTSNTINDNNNYFMRLHAFVLTEICNSLLDILNILDIYPINISNEKLENFGSDDYIIYRINQELSRQYVTYRVDILKAIKSYILNKNNRYTTNNISYVGSNVFYKVWEEVCKIYKNDCLETKISDLNLSFKENKDDSLTLKEVIEKPKWLHNGSNKSHSAKKSLEPDIISIEQKEMSIYDAKYYNIILNEKKVSQQPGIESITKQYLYQLAFKDFIEENDLVFSKNAFLFPTELDEELFIGYAKLDIFKDLKDIELVMLPCTKVFNHYLLY